MGKNKFFVVIGMIILVVLWKNYIPESIILGKYVNNNTSYILEGPSPIQNGKDTLRLLENGIFGKTRIWLNYDMRFYFEKID